MVQETRSFSLNRLAALCWKESRQIIRDPGSIMISFILPLILLVIFGYGVNFDSSAVRLGVVLQDQSPEARRFADCFRASPFFEVTMSDHREDLVDLMTGGQLRGIVIIPVDFSRKLAQGDQIVPIQVITDGTEPNTANFVQGYVTGAWQIWQEERLQDAGRQGAALLEIQTRYWFNQAAISRNFIVPGAITIIMTVIGTILTSLVIAREWERGTMEALLSTRITRAELLLSKLIPYYLLGMFALAICMVMSIAVFQVPFRGSWLLLWGMSSLFLACALGMGLLISTLTRNQFNAAQIALNAAFLPAVMLSGFVFEIDSMPAVIRGITYLIPARYYVSAMHTLFLAGNVPFILMVNAAFMLFAAIFFIGLTALKTRLRLE